MERGEEGVRVGISGPLTLSSSCPLGHYPNLNVGDRAESE